MTDVTSKTKHKLRRWIIVGVLLLMVGIAGWQFWPRGDSRFTGMWEREPGGGVFVLQSSGQFEHFTRDGKRDEDGRWWVEGDRLVFRRRPIGLFDRGLLNGFRQLMDYATRRTHFAAYQLFSVSDNVIHLKLGSLDKRHQDMILGRIDKLPSPQTTRRMHN
jgi:hypothetical protein